MKILAVTLMTTALLLSLPSRSYSFDFEDLDSKLHAIITNPASSDSALLQAISRLGAVTELPSFWTSFANDPIFSECHRSRAIFALFRRHGRDCRSLRKLATQISPAKWLQIDCVRKVTAVTGSIPVELSEDTSVFTIRVLWGRDIYIRVLGDVGKDTFTRVLFGGTATPDKEDCIVFQYGFGDDYDERLAPHTAANPTKN